MRVLIFSEILFNLTASFAIIAVGVLLAFVAYHLMHITKKLRHISDNLSDISDDTKDAIEEIIEKLSNLPILSFFMKGEGRNKDGKESKNKGRTNK